MFDFLRDLRDFIERLAHIPIALTSQIIGGSRRLRGGFGVIGHVSHGSFHLGHRGGHQRNLALLVLNAVGGVLGDGVYRFDSHAKLSGSGDHFFNDDTQVILHLQ